MLLVLTSAVILRYESHRTHDCILRSQIRDCPNLEGQVLIFISPRNRVARLYHQTPGSLFVASYDPQGYSLIYDSVWVSCYITSERTDRNTFYFSVDHPYPVFTETSPVTTWFLRIRLHGNVFADPFPNNVSTRHSILFYIYWAILSGQ
jgi:hypothetical protein